MCNNAHREVVKNNLHAEGTQFSIHVHNIEQWTYYRVKEQSVCNNAHSEESNNLQAERTQFNIHVHRAVDILQGKGTISVTMLIVRS